MDVAVGFLSMLLIHAAVSTFYKCGQPWIFYKSKSQTLRRGADEICGC